MNRFINLIFGTAPRRVIAIFLVLAIVVVPVAFATENLDTSPDDQGVLSKSNDISLGVSEDENPSLGKSSDTEDLDKSQNEPEAPLEEENLAMSALALTPYAVGSGARKFPMTRAGSGIATGNVTITADRHMGQMPNPDITIPNIDKLPNLYKNGAILTVGPNLIEHKITGISKTEYSGMQAELHKPNADFTSWKEIARVKTETVNFSDSTLTHSTDLRTLFPQIVDDPGPYFVVIGFTYRGRYDSYPSWIVSNIIINPEFISPSITIDKITDPTKITLAMYSFILDQPLDNIKKVWTITSTDGKGINKSGETQAELDAYFGSLPLGKYQITYSGSVRSVYNYDIKGIATRTFQVTKLKPFASITVDREINPRTATGSSNAGTFNLDYRIERLDTGEIIHLSPPATSGNSFTHNPFDYTKYTDGDYRICFTQSDSKGVKSTSTANFTVRLPSIDIEIKDSDVNPTSITGITNDQVPAEQSKVTWEIWKVSDSATVPPATPSGAKVASGDIRNVPTEKIPTIDGKYAIYFTHKVDGIDVEKKASKLFTVLKLTMETPPNLNFGAVTLSGSKSNETPLVSPQLLVTDKSTTPTTAWKVEVFSDSLVCTTDPSKVINNTELRYFDKAKQLDGGLNENIVIWKYTDVGSSAVDRVPGGQVKVWNRTNTSNEGFYLRLDPQNLVGEYEGTVTWRFTIGP